MCYSNKYVYYYKGFNARTTFNAYTNNILLIYIFKFFPMHILCMQKIEDYLFSCMYVVYIQGMYGKNTNWFVFLCILNTLLIIIIMLIILNNIIIIQSNY